jgi:hypothetical protein
MGRADVGGIMVSGQDEMSRYLICWLVASSAAKRPADHHDDWYVSAVLTRDDSWF